MSIALTASAFSNSVRVNTHMDFTSGPYANVPLIDSLLTQLGITHLRDGAIYSTVYNSNTYYYQNLRALAAPGRKLSLVCYGPQFPNFFTPPDQAANISAWCNGAVEQFEGDNETNLKAMTTRDPPMSVWMQSQLYHTIRSVLTVPVLGPSYIWNGCMNGSVDLRIPIPSICSQVNAHLYPGCEHPETTTPVPGGGLLSQLAWARIAQDVVGGTKAAQLTESGYHSALSDPSQFFGVSEGMKARYIVRMLLWYYLNGVAATYLYQLVDDSPNDQTKNATMFGLADYNGNPKPCFGAVAKLMALCAQRSVATGATWAFSLSGDQTNVQTLLLKRSDGSAVLFVWLGVSGWDRVNKVALPPVTRVSTLTITGGTPSAVVGHLFNDDGTQTIAPLVPVTGGYALTISDQVAAIEIA
jgi:hypothetical protein